MRGGKPCGDGAQRAIPYGSKVDSKFVKEMAVQSMWRYGVVLCLLVIFPVQAGSMAGGAPQFPAEQIVAFAKKVEKTLAAKGARVAIVARMGRPASELPEGFHYTHAGFAVYSRVTTNDGRVLPAYAMYNLYQRDDKPDNSHLVQDFPLDFFAGAQVLEAGVLIPSPELQRRLLETLASPVYKSLHDPRYSAIANPYTLERQNCTEFVLDVVNAAIYQTGNIKHLKDSERAYFEAQPVKVGPIKLLLGSLFSADITTSDHPDVVETATFETIARYLLKYDEGSELLTVLAEPPVELAPSVK